MHVLCFSPYVRWSLHSARHAAILHGLHQRGVKVLHVACDALMSECDLYQPAKGPAYQRTALTCVKCQAETTYLLARSKLNFLWLGRWLMQDQLKDAHAWAATTKDITGAVYNDWPIGAWVQSSVHSYYRSERLDLNDAQVVQTYRRHLASGAVIAFCLDALFEQEQPDVQLLFNGRMAPMRIALELGRLRGVRTITEERGFAPGYMRLVENTDCLDPNPFYRLCQDWRGRPLILDELEDLSALLTNHINGTGHELSLFAAPVKDKVSLQKRLGLDEDKTTAVLFTSATDESHSQPETAGSFASQHDWIRSTLSYFRQHPSLQLIIRAHPNSGGKRAVGNNQEELAFLDHISSNHPENVTLVAPEDDISSYDLMKIADVGLMWHSSLCLEMAALGKPVLRAGAY